MTLIVNERQHEFNLQVDLKSLSIIYGRDGDEMTEEERGGVLYRTFLNLIS